MSVDDTEVGQPGEDRGEQSDRFPWPEEIDLPAECDGWEDMYPRYYRFGQSDERREHEHGQFWFLDQKNTPRPLRPWDITFPVEACTTPLSQAQSRVLAIPPAMSIDIRIVAGYMYVSPTPVTDPERLKEREEIFRERSGFIYQNFEDLYEEEWLPAVKEIGREIDAIEVPDDLPEYAPDEVVFESQGLSSLPVDIQEGYNRLQELTLEGWHRHFEYLILTYLAYLTFKETCEELFPDISDNAIGKMVTGLETDLFRSNQALNDLAELAIELGDPVPEILTSKESPEVKMARLQETETGREFLETFEEVKDPWFYITNSRGYHTDEGSWLDTLEQPFGHLRNKIESLQAGEEIRRDLDAIREERDELVEEYRSFLDAEAQEQFDQAYGTVMNIYTHAEDHQFWIENWLHTIIFRKLDEFGELLVTRGLLEEPRDITLFGRHEVGELLHDLGTVWSQGPNSFVPQYWKEEAQQRKQILEAAEAWDPPLALCEPPEELNDPFVIMLWGITEEKVNNWLSPDTETSADELSGFASSSGVVEGPARVLTSTAELDDLEDGEILVCELTNPDWTPVFSRIEGAITDNGGVTSHTAIVCREYGLPAVTGTSIATANIETGDHVRVNGDEGTVEILEKANA